MPDHHTHPTPLSVHAALLTDPAVAIEQLPEPARSIARNAQATLRWRGCHRDAPRIALRLAERWLVERAEVALVDVS